MSELSQVWIEDLRVRARRAKAMAMDAHKMGDLAGAKEHAVQAKKMNPYLNGLARLNAVLDVLLGFEQKIAGEVDWYAVLAVDLTADIATIQRRNKKLLRYILMDDSDDSVGSIDEAKKILADCWTSFCDEDSKRLYDKRRQERVDYVKQQQLTRASQGPSFTSNPVTLLEPNPLQRVSKGNELMVPPPVRVSGQVPMSTVATMTLSPHPPESVRKENEQLVQPPVRVSGQVHMSTVTPVTFSAPTPPQRVTKETERMLQPSVRVSGQVPKFTVTPVTFSAPSPSQRVRKENEGMVQPPVRGSSHQVPMSTVTPVTLSATSPPQRAGKEKERMVQPSVGVSGKVPMSTVTPVNFSGPSQPQRVSNENERMVLPPVRVSGKVPMSTVTLVTLSAPSPPKRVSKENKRMVQPPVRGSGHQVPMSTVTPVTLSATNPPQRVGKEKEGMVQPPVGVFGKVPTSTVTPVTFSGPSPPQRASKEKERMVQPPGFSVFTSPAFNPPLVTKEKVIVSSKVPLFTISPVSLSPSPSQRPKMFNREMDGPSEVKVGKHNLLPSQMSVDDLRRATQVPSSLGPEPDVESPRLITFGEEQEESVEVNVTQFVQPPVSSPLIKRKAPAHMLNANKLRRINGDAGIRSTERRGDNVVPGLEWLASAFQQVNVASSSSSSAAIPPQESNAMNSVNTERTNKQVPVQWNKGVYPKKGDVWATYENWSPSWGSSTPKEEINKYEMVEVVEDFDEVRGVTVAPLVKVPGFIAVFRLLPIPKTFPKKELLRFSHRVPSRLFTGHEGKNGPKGFLELDPAALPPELLQVFTKVEQRKF